MGFLDNAKKKAAELADKAGDAAAKGIDKAAEGVDKATKGKYHDKIENASNAAERAVDRDGSAGTTAPKPNPKQQ